VGWKRKKPLWPSLAAMMCLFALAIAAPIGWQRQRQRPTQQRVMQQRPMQTVVEPAKVDRVKDAIAAPAEENVLAPSSRKASRLIPSIRRLLPRPSEWDFGRLLAMRDALQQDVLQQVVDKLPKGVSRSSDDTGKDTAPPRVRVSSPTDRLAMIDRSRFTFKLSEIADSAPATVGSEPIIAKQNEARLSAPVAVVSPPPIPRPPALLRARPTALVEQLTDCPAKSPSSEWSAQVLALIGRLADDSATGAGEVAAVLNEIERLAGDAQVRAAELSDVAQQSRWSQSAESLNRRLPIWRALLAAEVPVGEVAKDRTDALMPVLVEIRSLLADASDGAQWREYLMLDRVAVATSESAATNPTVRGKLAQQVLRRMSNPQLTEAQREFLATQPLDNYFQQLRPWAAVPVDLHRLTLLVEHYESSREVRFANAIAQAQQRLQWAADPRMQALAGHLEQCYRDANMRIAVSSELFNRMMPGPKTTVSPVRDRIAGAKVRGQARTTTRLHVRFLPDPEQWHFGLEAAGKVYSNTRTETWPAWVRSAAKFQYQAQKDIVINRNGLRLSPTHAQASGRNELLGVESLFDPIPIISHILHDLAKSEHRKSRLRAVTEVKAKVARQAKRQMDSQADAKFTEIEQKFRDHVLTPIAQLALIAQPLEMSTTENRAVMRLRLANAAQLAAHTKRPLAPSDSVVSFQMHETVLNNAATGLCLDGRRMTMLDLFDYFAKKFRHPDAVPPEDLQRRVVIEFAAHDAIQFKFDHDRLELILRIKELSRGRDKIKNFAVHVHFLPVVEGLDVRLVRDGTLQFAGRRLKAGPRFVLHSVFGKVIAKDQEIGLLALGTREDPRLSGLMVTQLVIHDGWVGLALGPHHPDRVAWRTPANR